ncbi:MAG TPA: hypothetical protein VNX65_03430 [Patescibacteria group bacterium]|jgi:hypothetical protein|nr:hypothetical protein [Patescibacteria group bacterium]
MSTKQYLKALTFSVFVYGFAGWIYIALNAASHPETLSLPLTHLLPWPREDTFGAVCFGVSFIALLAYRILKEAETQTKG